MELALIHIVHYLTKKMRFVQYARKDSIIFGIGHKKTVTHQSCPLILEEIVMILTLFQILISSNVNKVRNTLIVKIQEFVIHVIRDLKESKVANLA